MSLFQPFRFWCPSFRGDLGHFSGFSALGPPLQTGTKSTFPGFLRLVPLWQVVGGGEEGHPNPPAAAAGSRQPLGLPRRAAVPIQSLPVYCLEKTRGDRSRAALRQGWEPGYRRPLIPSVVAPHPFDSAIANALVRLHFDKPLCLHPNGEENKFGSCLPFHSIV